MRDRVELVRATQRHGGHRSVDVKVDECVVFLVFLVFVVCRGHSRILPVSAEAPQPDRSAACL
jgi:hypothetical protein